MSQLIEDDETLKDLSGPRHQGDGGENPGPNT